MNLFNELSMHVHELHINIHARSSSDELHFSRVWYANDNCRGTTGGSIDILGSYWGPLLGSQYRINIGLLTLTIVKSNVKSPTQFSKTKKLTNQLLEY